MEQSVNVENESYVARLDKRGRVTLAKGLREALGVSPREPVEWAIDDGQVFLRAAKGSLGA